MAFRSDAQQGKGHDPREIEGVIGEFEKKLDRLKTLYEQYFMGIEKREPSVALKDVVRVMRSLEQEEIRNTGLRFRYRTLVQRFNTYRTYWHRTLREIERGTYHRDLARLQRHLAREGIDIPKAGRLRSVADVERAISSVAQQQEAKKEDTDRMAIPAPAAGVRGASAAELRERLQEPRPEPALGAIDLDEDEEKTDRHLAPARPGMPGPAPHPPAMQPRTPSSPNVQAPRTPSSPNLRPRSPAGGGGPSEAEISSLYQRFVRAKELCGEDTSGVRIESLRKSIEHQMPKIQQMYQGRGVEFQVVIRSGRAILKAKPK